MNMRRTALSMDVYLEVKNLIFDRKIPLHQELDINKIALQLDINDLLLQSVLHRLLKEGMLVMAPANNYRVRQLKDFEIIDFFEARTVLQTKAAKIFALRAPQCKIDDLRSLLLPFGKGPTNPGIYKKIDCHFHKIIVQYCGNPFLWDAFNRANMLSYMALIGLLRPPQDIFDEHLNIVSAFHQREPERAAALMERHLERSKAEVLNRL